MCCSACFSVKPLNMPSAQKLQLRVNMKEQLYPRLVSRMFKHCWHKTCPMGLWCWSRSWQMWMMQQCFWVVLNDLMPPVLSLQRWGSQYKAFELQMYVYGSYVSQAHVAVCSSACPQLGKFSGYWQSSTLISQLNSRPQQVRRALL